MADAVLALPAAIPIKIGGNDNYRKIVLNAIYWTAHLEVPLQGVPSTITPEFLTKNLDNDR